MLVSVVGAHTCSTIHGAVHLSRPSEILSGGACPACACRFCRPLPPPVLRKEFTERDFDFVAVDELRRMVNPKTFRYQLTFAVRAHRFVIISGSPILNGRPKELWPILNRLAPEVFSSESEYMRHSCSGRTRARPRWKSGSTRSHLIDGQAFKV